MKFILWGIFTLSVYGYSDAAKSYYDTDAVIVGEEYIFVAGNSKDSENTKMQDRQTETLSNDLSYTEEYFGVEQPANLPFAPQTYLRRKDIAVLPLQRRISRYRLLWHISRENICPDIEGFDLPLYLPERRQKPSPAVAQYGILTSFSSHSPPFILS